MRRPVLICRLSGSVIEQPLKIPFIAATVLVANDYKSELVEDVLKRARESLQQYIDVGAWREVKLLLRFLGCLQSIFEGDGVFPILEELFARAVDLQTASSEDVSELSSTFLRNRGWSGADVVSIVARTRARQNYSLHDPIHYGISSYWV